MYVGGYHNLYQAVVRDLEYWSEVKTPNSCCLHLCILYKCTACDLPNLARDCIDYKSSVYSFMNEVFFISFTWIKLKIIGWSKGDGIDNIAYGYLDLLIYYHTGG